ncbi:hypothetical protein AGR7A_Cc200006 [Agrobacterium deltaense NCPPB 1641]|uniref:Uncharacterized protein n=1 Tax=Agrobacterium deltaense NCPPB 1641 TaxID=1183425 RepID=A0A1S7TLE2_9HYPH|nr:hypothetical protein AGR7A_Cc200006 [Agrobacterium deltaense NCPPB 1641]
MRDQINTLYRSQIRLHGQTDRHRFLKSISSIRIKRSIAGLRPLLSFTIAASLNISIKTKNKTTLN